MGHRAEKERLRDLLQGTERASSRAKTCLVIPDKWFEGLYHTFDSQLPQYYGLRRKANFFFLTEQCLYFVALLYCANINAGSISVGGSVCQAMV